MTEHYDAEAVKRLGDALEELSAAYLRALKLLGSWPLFSEGKDLKADALVHLHAAISPLLDLRYKLPSSRAAQAHIEGLEKDDAKWDRLFQAAIVVCYHARMDRNRDGDGNMVELTGTTELDSALQQFDPPTSAIDRALADSAGKEKT